MKRLLSIALMFTIIISLVGCSASAGNKAANSNAKTVGDVLATAESTQPSTNADAYTAQSQTTPVEINYPELDYSAEIDLTELSGSMVYSEVSSMVITPDNYLGKSVKANGTFDVYTDINTGKYYYACIIQDATACCANGLEFIPAGEVSFPDDFPEVGTPITIGGIFGTYEENGAVYCCLEDAQFIFDA